MQKRIENFRRVCDEKQLDAILIKSKTNKKYLNALTGSGVKLLLTKDCIYQIMDGRYVNEANETTTGFTNIIHSQASSYLDELERLLPKGARLGIESNQTYAQEYIKLCHTSFEIILLDNELEVERRCKDQQEIALVKKACEITDYIFKECCKKIHVGMKECEISAYIQYLAIQQGASQMAFDTIVVSGKRGAMPHGRPTDKLIAPHEFITIDFGITYQGYQSDMTRTICIGTPDPLMKRIYNIVLEAQCAGVEFIKAGVSGKEVDAHVRGIIEGYGYGEYFTHGLGHGMGMGEGELPMLNQRSDTILEEGMIMSCEPGIYIPNVGGVRIEDDVLIQDGKGVALNHTTKDLIILEER